MLLLGAGGQLGTDVVNAWPSRWDLKGLKKSELDITKGQAVRQCLGSYKPDIVINAAAYTDVDGAEKNQAYAHQVNAEAVVSLSRYCADLKIKLIHISTDYVFDGYAQQPYKPSDSANPINVYGKTKWAGEQAALSQAKGQAKALIFRVSWLYSHHHKNFLTTMLRLFHQKKVIHVVKDQFGSPTYSPLLADLIIKACESNHCGVYHWCDKGCISWCEFAETIAEHAVEIGVLKKPPKIVPVLSREYPMIAKRPRYTALDCEATERDFIVKPRNWSQNLREALKKIKEKGAL